MEYGFFNYVFAHINDQSLARSNYEKLKNCRVTHPYLRRQLKKKNFNVTLEQAYFRDIRLRYKDDLIFKAMVVMAV
jgi:hypothetical protein